MKSPLYALGCSMGYALGFAAVLSSCASVQPNAYLNEAEAYVNATQSIQGIDDAAAVSMAESRKALQTASALHAEGASDEVVEHHALVASKHSEIARERLAIATAQQELNRAETDRQELLLSARERRARRAEGEALSAKAEAEEAAREARLAREEARLASAEAAAATEAARIAQQQLSQAQADAAQMAREIDELKARESERGIVLTLEDIVFGFDSAELQPGGARAVSRIAEFLNEYSNRQVLIEGHTDSVGDAGYNETLSSQRAESVRNELISMGISGDRVSTRGLGEEYPVASNQDDAGRQANRRVELIVANQDDTEVGQREE